MKSKYSIIYMTLLVFSFTSCEKVINLELNTTAPKIVVDGQVTNSEAEGSVPLFHPAYL